MRPVTSYKAVVFDLEGVLIQSQPYIFSSMKQALEDYGIELDEDLFRERLGMSLEETVDHLETKYDVSIDTARLAERMDDKQFALMEDEADFEVAKRAFDMVDEVGLRIAVATSSMRERAIKIIRIQSIDTVPDTIISADDVEAHKPAPDSYSAAADQLGVPEGSCIAVEDTERGVRSAQRAGMEVIAIRHDYNQQDDLAIASTVASSLDESTSLIKRMVR